MRVLKFRAWDKIDGLMYYNIQDGIQFSDKSVYEFRQFLNKGKEDYHEWGIMQFTGLKDKRGREIYEGDTVYATRRGEEFETKFAIIRWSDYLKCMVVYSKDTDIDDCLPIGRFYELEVIGNIYEQEQK